MFELEDKAAKVESDEAVKSEAQPTSPVEEQEDQTKAFAKRLKEEKAKAKSEAREEIAKSFGYDSWDEYYNAQTNSKLLDKGLDPDSVRPVIEDFMKNDPQYIEAMKYKAEKEELEKEIFASDSIKALNSEMGTHYSSVKDLDAEVVDLWNKGLSLSQAYAAIHYNQIKSDTIKKSVDTDNGKSHMVPLTGSKNDSVKERTITDEEMSVFKAFGINPEEAKEFIKKHQN